VLHVLISLCWALDDWPDIDFLDDRGGCIFTVTVYRKTKKGSGEMVVFPKEQVLSQEGSEKGSEKSSEKILKLLSASPQMTILQLANQLGISTRAVEKQIAKLRERGFLKRIGPAKGGYWKVL